MTGMQLTYNGRRADLANPIDISIAVTGASKQLRAFGSTGATVAPYKAGSFIGDVAAGGSCNCALYHFSPHLHGTHTEGVGHITAQKFPVHALLKSGLMPCVLVTVEPVKDDGDFIINRSSLQAAGASPKEFLTALIVRTTPNNAGKRLRDYTTAAPAYFAPDAMREIVELGVQHLLCDLPSVDKADDGGKLANHRLFWGVGAADTKVAVPSSKTITELVYVPDEVADGIYFLDLQLAAFDGDAAPSRPVLYKVLP